MRKDLKKRIEKAKKNRQERRNKAKVDFERAGQPRQKIDVIAEYLGMKEPTEEKQGD